MNSSKNLSHLLGLPHRCLPAFLRPAAAQASAEHPDLDRHLGSLAANSRTAKLPAHRRSSRRHRPPDRPPLRRRRDRSACISPTPSAPSPAFHLGPHRAPALARLRRHRSRHPTSPSPSPAATDVTIPAGAEYHLRPHRLPRRRRSPTSPSPSISTRRPRANRPSRLPRHLLLRSWRLRLRRQSSPTPKHVDHWYQLSGIDVLAAPRARLHRRARRLHHRRPRRHHQRQRPLDRRSRRAPPGLARHAQHRRLQPGHRRQPPAHRRPRPQRARPLRSRRPRARRRPLAHRLRRRQRPRRPHAPSAMFPPPSTPRSSTRILAAYQQIIDRAHAHGIRSSAPPSLPYVGSDYYHPGPRSEADRQAVNHWIRAPGHFDAVLDFDKVVRDPAHPDHAPRLRLRRPPSPIARRLPRHGRIHPPQALRALSSAGIGTRNVDSIWWPGTGSNLSRFAGVRARRRNPERSEGPLHHECRSRNGGQGRDRTADAGLFRAALYH